MPLFTATLRTNGLASSIDPDEVRSSARAIAREDFGLDVGTLVEIRPARAGARATQDRNDVAFAVRDQDLPTEEDGDEDLSILVPVTFDVTFAAAGIDEARAIAPFVPEALRNALDHRRDLERSGKRPTAMGDRLDRIAVGEPRDGRTGPDGTDGGSTWHGIGAPRSLLDRVATLALGSDPATDILRAGHHAAVEVDLRNAETTPAVALGEGTRTALMALHVACGPASAETRTAFAELEPLAGPATLRALARRQVLEDRLRGMEEAALIAGHFGAEGPFLAIAAKIRKELEGFPMDTPGRAGRMTGRAEDTRIA